MFVRDEDARSHLLGLQQVNGRLMRGEAYYIIYQDLLEFNLLHVLGVASDGKHLVTYRLGYNTKPNSQSGFVFCVNTKNGPQTYEDPQELKFYLNTTLGLGTHIYPKGGHSSVCVCACVRVYMRTYVCAYAVHMFPAVSKPKRERRREVHHDTISSRSRVFYTTQCYLLVALEN